MIRLTARVVAAIAITTASFVAGHMTAQHPASPWQHRYVQLGNACEEHATFGLDTKTYVCVTWPRNGD